ncbi:MAG TPA: tetratricopeptide repeat protein [Acidobacteriota bacterium]|nr:tetratricopeptide repeat protein [Acidobacteriota bacterium]
MSHLYLIVVGLWAVTSIALMPAPAAAAPTSPRAEAIGSCAALRHACRMGPVQEVALLLEQAADAAARGDWDSAHRALNRARRLAPQRADVLFELGVILERVEDPVGAISAYRQAIALDSSLVPAIENLASVLASHGDLDGAIYLLTVALEQYPETASLHYHRALLVFRREQRLVTPAIDGLERAHALGYSRPHLFLLLGRVARIGGDAAKARGIVQQGLDQTPQDAELLREMGLALAALGELDDAARHLAAAVRVAPAETSLAVDLGRVYLRANRTDDVIALLGELTDLPDALFLLGQAQQALGRPEARATLERFQALQARTKAAQEAEARAMVEVATGIESWNGGDVQSAAEHFERALSERPGWATARSYLAAARLESGQTEAAIELATALLATDQGNAQALMVLGRARLRESIPEGLAFLERAASLYPYRAVCLLTLAQAYVDAGRGSDATSLVERAAAIEPDSPWVDELRRHLKLGAG